MTEHTKHSKWLTLAGFGALVMVVSVVIVGLNNIANQSNPVWRDFGTVQNIHNTPEWAYGTARYFQSMIIQTDNHGSMPLDTGPNGNWCTGMTIFSCGSGTVAWSNGTRVFIEKRQDGNLFVGALAS